MVTWPQVLELKSLFSVSKEQICTTQNDAQGTY